MTYARPLQGALVIPKSSGNVKIVDPSELEQLHHNSVQQATTSTSTSSSSSSSTSTSTSTSSQSEQQQQQAEQVSELPSGENPCLIYNWCD